MFAKSLGLQTEKGGGASGGTKPKVISTSQNCIVYVRYITQEKEEEEEAESAAPGQQSLEEALEETVKQLQQSAQQLEVSQWSYFV